MVSIMLTVAIYSEAGGVSKSTTAVSLAAVAAEQGHRVLLIDLDPRASSTSWIGVQPRGDGLDVSAILGNADPDGWAGDLAVPAPAKQWPEGLDVLPATRLASLVESSQAHHQEVRLRRSLVGADYDLAVIDCPNRQGGPLTLAALTAADHVLYAAVPNADGREGVTGGRESVRRHRANLAALGAPERPHEAGIVLGAVTTSVTPRIERHTIDQLDQSHPGLLLRPFIPRRTIVQQAREASDWYDRYSAGQAIAQAYRDVLKAALPQLSATSKNTDTQETP